MSKSTTGKPTTLKLDARAEQAASTSDTTSSTETSSGDVVIAAATSGSGSVSKVYKHWADGDDQPAQWQGDILQDNKSNYFEGEVIPHVFVYTASNNTPLVNGQSYSFNITYNFYQANTNAGGFAFITTYDISRDPGLVPGLSQIEPVDDASFTNGGGTQGIFDTVDANITSVSGVTYTDSGNGLDGYVTVTFTYTGTTTTSGFAEIYYGLFVANPGQVPDQGSGTTDGAAAWTGGSLQTTVDIGGSGATSLQLAPSAIIVGEISGIKFSDINGDGVRDADGADNIAGNADDEAGLAGWTIFLDTNGNGTLDAGEDSTVTGADGTYVFSVIPDADPSVVDNDPYLVREVQQAGWTQTTADPAPILITADDPTETNVNFGNQQPAPSILLAKDGVYIDINGNGALNAGDQIQYTFVVTNTGNVALTNVSITDDAFELDDPTDPTDGTILAAPIAIGNLAAGASSAPQVVNYTLTQEDLDDLLVSGDFAVDNLATAHGFAGATEVTDDDPATVQLPAGLDAILLIEKSAVIVPAAADADGIIDSADDDILYTITVTNGGDVTLNNVIVVDSRSTNVDDVVGTIPTLAPGESQTFTFEYDVLQSEIDANGTDADGVADNDGDIDNTAAAVADEAGPVFASAFVPLEQNPALNITKDASVPGGTADVAGELISYTITVENTGNQTLTGVTVTDPFADPGSIVRGADVVGDNDADLEIGETWGYTAQHTVTQAEIDSNGGGDGFLENTATADSDQTGPDTDDASVPVAQIPAISLAKDGVYIDVNGDGALSVGDQIQYTFVATNTGNVALTNVSITEDPLDFDLNDPSDPTDPAILAAPIAIGNLAVGESSAPQIVNYTLTQEDLDDLFVSGDFLVDNLATAHGFAGATEVTDDDPAAVQLPAGLDAVLLIDKSAVIVPAAGDADGIIDSADDDILYSITVTNGGDVTLNNVIVVDPRSTNVDDVVGTIATLAPGDSQTFTFEYDVLQSEIDANGTDADGVADGDGDIDNTSAAVADEAGPVFDSAFVPLEQNPALNITKDASVPGGTADVAGELISYTITVENTGNQTLTGVTVTDPFADPGSIVRGADVVGDNDADLEVGETWGFTATHTVTQAELDSNGGGDGQLENTATADSDQTGPDTDDASVPVAQNPALNITKDASVPGGTADVAGELISYTITVENTGNVALTGVTVTDPFADPGSIVRGADVVGDNDADLEVGETWGFTATHTVTQAEIDSNGGGDGFLENTATADSDQTGPDTDDASVPVEQRPELNITKDASVPGGTADAAGELISYTITVENTGNVALTGVTVTDPFADPGSIVRGADVVGDNDADLEVGETWGFTAQHTVTQAEIDSNGGGDGQLENTATADSDQTGPDTDDASVPVAQNPALNITKDASVPGGTADAAGELISYTITVENTGNQTLTGVTVTDPFADPGSIVRGADVVGDNDADLEVGETWGFTAQHTVTQAEIDSNGGGDGFLENTATADSDQTGPDTDDAAVPVEQRPELNITKDASVPGGTADAAGELISYTITVENTGNVALTGVTVTDPFADPGSIVRGADVVGDNDADLEVGETWGFTATHTVTQDEIDSNGGGDGFLENTATADSDQTGPDTDDAAVPVEQRPELNITKDASVPGGTADAAGELISYTITVENTGNVALTGVTVTDPFADPGSIVRGADVVGDNDADLEVGETWGFTAQHTVTQAEIDSNGGGDGFLENIATADSDQTGPDTDDAAVPVEQRPSLTIDKTVTDVGGDGPAGVVDEAGDVISYEIVVDNTGNIALTGVTVTDEVEASGATVLGSPTGDTDNDGALDIDETWTYTASYVVTQADLDNNGGGDGFIHNVAIVDTDQTPPDDDEEFVPLVQNPLINIDKITVAGAQSGDGLTGVQAGSAISWEYTVTNIGNVTLGNVVVTDDAGTPGNTADDFTATFTGGDADGDNLLDLGEVWTFSASGTAIVGQYNNLGTVTAFETDGDPDPVTDSDPSSYVGVGDFALIAPTQTSCHDYINGTGQSLDLAQYSVRNGEVSQTNPGVFFYYTGLSGAIAGTDANADGAVDPLTIFIDQSDDSAVIGAFDVHKSQVLLFKIEDLNDNGIIDAGDECVRVKLDASQISISDGDVTVNFTPDGVDSLYVLSVKYSTNSLVGTDVDAPFPTVHYDFETLVNGTFAETDSGGLDFAPKTQSTAVAQLDPVLLIGSTDPTSADVFMT